MIVEREEAPKMTTTDTTTTDNRTTAVQKAKVELAAREYRARQSRTSDPVGEFDRGGRWFPRSGAEERPCCKVRYPSRSWPYSKMVHCRTAKHIAELYGVSAVEVRRAARRLPQPWDDSEYAEKDWDWDPVIGWVRREDEG